MAFDMYRSFVLIVFCFISVPPQLVNAQSDLPDRDILTLEEIFHEPVLPGIRPSMQYFSGDQQSIIFSWNDSSYYETGQYKLQLNDEDKKPEPLQEDAIRPVHSPNNRLIAYTKEDTLYVSNHDGSSERQIFSSENGINNLTWSPNNRTLAFENDGDVWVANIARTGVRQITNKKEEEPNYSIDGWTGRRALILRQTDFSDASTIYFPEYVDEFVEPGAVSRGIPAVNIYRAPLDTGKADLLMEGVHRSSTAGSYSGRYVVVDSADAALKSRELIRFDNRDDSKSVIFSDSTDGWLYGRLMQPAPGSDQILFLSEQTGWNHLYTADLLSGDITQHTSGEFEITWAGWLSDNEIIYASNEADYGERHVSILNLDTRTSEQLTSDEAYRYQFTLSPDRSKIVYAKTFFNEPYDLFMIDLDEQPVEVQLTRSVPERYYEVNWQNEEYVRFTGRDGETELSMSVLYPAGYDSTRQYPVVVFAHGAGSLQNVYKGWSNNYWREYMFNQFLNLNGYIVIEVDFRHSTGYGRKFREDVTNWMGRYETRDIVDGLDWLEEKTGGAPDLENVGIYGGSYGGFMALYALTDKPERFHVGAALRKVSNWRNYYHANPWYTLPRLGDPEEVPEHYDRSSPLTYADELEHPVILLHGLIDDNVGAQDAFQYADELIKSGHEEFEMMIYPSEGHGFTSPGSWYDEYRRVFEFFEEHLKE